MGNSTIHLTLLFGAFSFLGLAGTSLGEDENALLFEPPIRIIARSKLGNVIRGEMKSLSRSSVLVVPDRSRFRNPNGVAKKLDDLKMLNILDADLKWKHGEDTEEFLIKVSKSPGLPILNIVQFQQIELAKAADLNTPLGENTAPGKSMVMKPGKTGASKNDPSQPVTTGVCGNCFMKVSIDSKSGQKCPHCGTIWEDSPEEESTVLAAKGAKAPEAKKQNTTVVNSGQNVGVHQAPQVVASQQNVPAGKPVAVPPPVQLQPQEVTLENLPLWLKASVFCLCLGILYYAMFVR